MFNKILIARFGTAGAFASSTLGAIFGHRRALDIAQMRDGNDDFLLFDHFFNADLAIGIADLRTARITKFIPYFGEFLFDDFPPKGIAFQ